MRWDAMMTVLKLKLRVGPFIRFCYEGGDSSVLQ